MIKELFPTLILLQYEGSYGIGIASKIEVVQWHRLDLGNSPVGAPLLIPGDESGPGKVRQSISAMNLV